LLWPNAMSPFNLGRNNANQHSHSFLQQVICCPCYEGRATIGAPRRKGTRVGPLQSRSCDRSLSSTQTRSCSSTELMSPISGGQTTRTTVFDVEGRSRGSSALSGELAPSLRQWPARKRDAPLSRLSNDLLAEPCLDVRSCLRDAMRSFKDANKCSDDPWLVGVRLLGGVEYYGSMDNGIPHGQGRMRWPDGREYFGYFDQGQRTNGTMCWDDGRIYSGQWEDGCPHGHGRCSDKTGASWTGEWVEGRPVVV